MNLEKLFNSNPFINLKGQLKAIHTKIEKVAETVESNK